MFEREKRRKKREERRGKREERREKTEERRQKREEEKLKLRTKNDLYALISGDRMNKSMAAS